MAFTYRKKDIREEMDMLGKEGGKAALSSAPTGKVAGRAFVALVPVASTVKLLLWLLLPRFWELALRSLLFLKSWTGIRRVRMALAGRFDHPAI